MMGALGCGVCLSAPDAPAQEQEQAQKERLEADWKLVREFESQSNKQKDNDAAGAADAATRFLAEHPKLHADAMMHLYPYVGRLLFQNKGDIPGALRVVDQGLDAVPINRNKARLLPLKAEILLAQGKPQQAEELLQQNWPMFLEQAGWTAAALPVYGDALDAQLKSKEAIALYEQSGRAHLASFHNQNYLASAIVKGLSRQQQSEQALGWAKLHFLVCDFDDEAIKRAVKLLTDAWAVEALISARATPGEAPAVQFLAAQQDVKAPNPLRQVKLPALDEAALRTQLAQSREPSDRITFLILLGEWQQAMLSARRVMIENPTSTQGTLQVCRVFKAKDASLARANAFLAWTQTKEGENPLAEFLRETAAPA